MSLPISKLNCLRQRYFMTLRNYFVVLDYNEQKPGGFSQYAPDIARIPRSETRKELDKIFEVQKEY